MTSCDLVIYLKRKERETIIVISQLRNLQSFSQKSWEAVLVTELDGQATWCNLYGHCVCQDFQRLTRLQRLGCMDNNLDTKKQKAFLLRQTGHVKCIQLLQNYISRIKNKHIFLKTSKYEMRPYQADPLVQVAREPIGYSGSRGGCSMDPWIDDLRSWQWAWRLQRMRPVMKRWIYGDDVL